MKISKKKQLFRLRIQVKLPVPSIRLAISKLCKFDRISQKSEGYLFLIPKKDVNITEFFGIKYTFAYILCKMHILIDRNINFPQMYFRFQNMTFFPHTYLSNFIEFWDFGSGKVQIF